MLRITDARTGESVDASTARRGLTRVEVHAPGLDATTLRVLLVADVLVRALELGGTPVWALMSGDRDRAELRTACAALGVRPLEDRRDTGAAPAGARVIHVAQEGGTTSDGIWIGVAPVDPGPVLLGQGVVGGVNPDVLRLALLAPRRSTPVRLDDTSLDEARAGLAHWRRAVAAWARRPSRPVPDELREQLRGAWEDDLDIASVLRVLGRVESEPELPDGARFETYAYADRLLGLELTRDLGAAA
ncbi:hypothetical protein [Streptomyces cadmiisoli]|uniref:hypothetical protein n=1 Tax=Streptomyces cadmiisoli TaxID=2184053 RepID=UPI0036473F03